MAQIDRLSIQGIRSFNPSEPQDITFLPLTIILGPNGAGKTSIIESLKYITTGMMPPNTNSGKTFIHDIQFVDEPIVRGQIRLRFIDIENKSTIITRSMQATLKYVKDKPQVTFRQMNAVIKRDNKSIDQKLADINSELLKLIGVSKAILNNVIFCHQEEIHWPLSEGKVLKEKFDDIFGTATSSKLLETIKKIRDEEMQKYRLIEKDVDFTRQIKKEVDKINKQLNEEKSKIDYEKEKIRSSQAKISQLDLKTNDLMEKEQVAETVMNKILQLEVSIKEQQKQVENIQKNCPKYMFTLTKDEVDKKLEDFDTNIAVCMAQKPVLECQIKEINATYEKLFNEKQQFSSHIAKINECKNQFLKYFKEFENLVQNLSLTEELKQNFETLDHENLQSIENFIELIKKFIQNEITNAKASISKKKNDFSQKETLIYQDLESLKNEKSKISLEIEMRNTKIDKIKKELYQIQSAYSGNSSENYLKTLEEDISNFQSQLSKLKDEEGVKTEIQRLEKQREELTKDRDILNEKAALAIEQNQKRIRFEEFMNRKKEKSMKMDTIKMNNLDVFMNAGVVDGDFSDKLSILIGKKSEEYEEINSLIQQGEKKYFIESTELKNKKETLLKKKNELTEIENKLVGICQIDEFDDLLSSTEQSLKQLRNEKARLQNMVPVLDQFIFKIDQFKSCPICENDLSSEWISKSSGQKLHANKLLENLKKSKDVNPNKLTEIDEKICEKEKLYNKLISLSNEIASINDLKKDISQYEKEIQIIEPSISQIKSQLNQHISVANSIKVEMNCLQKTMQDAIDYDNSYNDLKDIALKLEQIDYNENPDFETDVNDLNFRLDQTVLNLKSCNLKLSNAHKEFLKITEEKMKLNNLLQTAERNKMLHKEKIQSRESNFQKKDELLKELEIEENEIANLNEKSGQVDPKIRELQNKLNSTMKSRQDLIDSLQRDIFYKEDGIRTLDRIHKEISHYLKELKISQSKVSKEYIDQLEYELQDSIKQKKSLTDEFNKISEEIVKAELDKRTLFDYQYMLYLKDEIMKQQEKMEKDRQEIGFMNMTSIKKERIEAERQRQLLIAQRESSKSRILELDQKVNDLLTELKQEEYQNAEKKYKNKLLEKAIYELSCEDLDKYYKALDHTVTTVHRNKIESINKLLDKFWKISYQGKDIESIQIMVDEDERSASDRRKNYSYRVAIIKQGKVLDMKGRCSAGQKVLACLIIRMALAMIFATNFNVITLDEPTTNLDSENIKAFAKAIENLRQVNPKLQIIVITHDEEFVKCLNNSTEKYYKVYKNQEGYSTISLENIDN